MEKIHPATLAIFPGPSLKAALPQLSLGLCYTYGDRVPDEVIRYYQRISTAIENKSQVQMEQEVGGTVHSIKKEKPTQG